MPARNLSRGPKIEIRREPEGTDCPKRPLLKFLISTCNRLDNSEIKLSVQLTLMKPKHKQSTESERAKKLCGCMSDTDYSN